MCALRCTTICTWNSTAAQRCLAGGGNPHLVLLLFDIKNCFNAVSRARLFRELAARPKLRQLLPLAQLLYAGESSMWYSCEHRRSIRRTFRMFAPAHRLIKRLEAQKASGRAEAATTREDHGSIFKVGLPPSMHISVRAESGPPLESCPFLLRL